MINQIELIVCDKCNAVMSAAGEVYMCVVCDTPMKRVKFVRQPTQRAADASPGSPLKNKRQVAKRR